MNLFQRNNTLRVRWSPSTGRKRIVIATLSVVLLILIDAFTGGTVRSVARVGGSLVWRWGVSIQNFIYESGFFATRRGLTSENSALKEQVAQFQERSAAYRVLQDENIALRGMLRVTEGAQSQNKEYGITAPIVSSFRSSPYGTFVIGAGSADSVAPGDLVLSAENFVLGRIEVTDARSSLVKEIFAPNASTDAVLHGIGVAVLGQGGGNARTDVPRQTEVVVGDPVISPIFGRRAIGIVGKISEDPGSAYKRAHIYLPVNLSALQFVYVVKN